MAEEKRDPRTRTGKPGKPAGPTTEAPRRGGAREDEPSPKRHHVSDDERDAGGDQMPKGFDEPGAGI
jgi:hypothetical protein